MLIRGIQDGDDATIRALFLATLALGKPLPFDLSRADRYADLCLGWYLTSGRHDGAVAVDDTGTIVGYALVCCDPAAYARASSRSTMSFAVRTAGAALVRRLSPESTRFYAERARDSVGLWHGRQGAPMPAHAHLNLRPDARLGTAARLLCSHVDERVRLAGAPGWYGEVNAEAGRRRTPLERVGLTTVTQRPNHTLSWMLGRPIVRLTVVQRVAPLGPPHNHPLRRNARNRPIIKVTITDTTSG